MQTTNEVTVYTVQECPYCNDLKNKLTKAGVTFTEKDLSVNEYADEFDEIHKLTKSDEVPLVVVGKQLLVPNVSYRSIDECVAHVVIILGL